MIRPYLAVIFDSYRAAASSWALYVMIGLVTLLLLLIFPFRIEEELASRIRITDVVDRVSLSQRLLVASKSSQETPAKRVWDRLPEDTQKLMRELYGDSGTSEVRPDSSEVSIERMQKSDRNLLNVLKDLNDLLEDETFYDESAWSNFALSDEARGLIEQGPDKLNDEELARLNRLLINTAFARELSPGPPTSIRLKYAFWNFFNATFPIRRDELPAVLNIPFLLDKFVLSIGVFVAILVTASVVPQMLEPGSLNLLLSKPISRWALFLAKYLGACAFIVVLSTYLFVGLWLFFGLRLGIWDSAFLACIPLYVLVFAIYFSVSVLVGAIFRNTIIAVVAAILFWVLCFVVGFGHSFISSFYENYTIDHLVVMDDKLMEIDVSNVPYMWDEESETWKQSFLSESNVDFAQIAHFIDQGEPILPRMFGPIYDAKHERLITAQTSMGNAGASMGSGHTIGIGRASNDWNYEESFQTPGLSVEMFMEPDGQLIVATRLGTIFRLKGDPVELMQEYEEKMRQAEERSATQESTDSGEADPDEKASDLSFDFDIFEDAGPSVPFDYSLPAAIAQNPATGELVVYSRGTLEVLTKSDSGRYERVGKSNVTLPSPKELSARIAFAGDWITVGRGNGIIYRIKRDSMEVVNSFEPEANAAITDVIMSPDGRWFAAIYSNGHLWMGDNQTDTPEVLLAKVKGQGDISAATFAESNDLLVADRINRVRRYAADGLKLEETLTPDEGYWGMFYRYALVPVYVICPKPGEFYRLATHLTRDKSDETTERRASDARNPWEPLWNGLIFIAVMLLIGCIYIERQDF